MYLVQRAQPFLRTCGFLLSVALSKVRYTRDNKCAFGTKRTSGKCNRVSSTDEDELCAPIGLTAVLLGFQAMQVSLAEGEPVICVGQFELPRTRAI